jgi:cytochrome c biogenesis protein CcdA
MRSAPIEGVLVRGKQRKSRLAGALALALALAVLAPAPGRASIPVPSGALALGGYDDDEPRVEARLLVHPDDQDASGPVRIGVLFDLDPGWHIYWRNPGETGLPTRVRWSVDGSEVGPTSWPAPSVFGESDGLFTSYGYADQVLLAAEATRREPAPGPRMARAEIELLVCEVECIPAKLSLSRRLDAGPRGSAPASDEVRRLFERYAARVPTAPDSLDMGLESLFSQSAIRPGDRFRAAIAVRSCASGRTGSCESLEPVRSGPAFFPYRMESIELEPTGIESRPGVEGGYLLTFDASAGPGEEPAEEQLSGVLALRGRDGALRHVEVDLPLPRARTGAEIVALDTGWIGLETPGPSTERSGFWHAVGLAFLGGLLLNLMPCVLPVLAIKVVALADLAHRARREVLQHGVAYTLGVLLTMSVLAGVVMLLRAAGTSVGWGFQFQEPLFVAAISIVLVVFALNLFGVFEIRFQGGELAQLGRDATGPKRSFFEGLLAVVWATPCTAPFLGAAVGFAFAGSSTVILAIFLAIGLGLATPFALVSLVPAWARWIPRSGAWMLKLRVGLGFALLASVVWLLWIIGRSQGSDGVIALIGLLLAVAFATWLYGVAQVGGGSLLRLVTGLGVVLLVLPGLVVVRGGEADPGPASHGEAHAWRPFEPAAVSDELAAGHSVFVYFTADWCLTCKVNEGRVIDDERVQAELRRMDVAVFRGDWTRRDEAIRTELARFGRAGVPLYLVYHPSEPERPVLLPEVLTADILLRALEPTAGRDGPTAVESS